MTVVTIAAVVNIFLDILLVAVFDLGAAGTAVATFRPCSRAMMERRAWLAASVARYMASSLSSAACLIISSQLG